MKATKTLYTLCALTGSILLIAGCTKQPTDTEEQTPEPEMQEEQAEQQPQEEQNEQPEEEQTDTSAEAEVEITDEDVKMIEDFLNEVIESVEGETTVEGEATTDTPSGE